jgi:ABC-2 type transport system ATP-binding protein
VEVERVTKRFKQVHALDGVSFVAVEGEAMALLGRNGAGKSTLLRILGTTVLADSGTVHIAGFDVAARAREVRRHVGFVLPDERSWYWRISGRENLLFFAALHGMPTAQAGVATERLLDLVGLTEDADRPFSGYSSGMRLRLSAARALLGEPTVLLLDEPTRSLDQASRRRFHEVLADLRMRGTTILIATHDADEAAVVADRAVILREGRVAEELATVDDAAAVQAALERNA